MSEHNQESQTSIVRTMNSKNKGVQEKPQSYCYRLFVTSYIAVIMVISVVIAFTLQILSWIIFLPLFLYSKKCRLVILGHCLKYLCFCVLTFFNPFWKIKVIKKCKKGYRPTKTLLIVNHLSSLDPWIINYCTFPWSLKYAFKSSLLKVPIVGTTLLLSGDIPIYFTKEKGGWAVKPGCTEKLMQTCKEYQSFDIGTVVFPEGTRSISGQLQLFKSGFFRFAIENNCEILPCALHGSNKLWPVKSTLLNSGTAYFSFGDPFRPSPGMTVDELKDKTRNAIYELVKGFPDYDAEVDKLLNVPVTQRDHGL